MDFKDSILQLTDRIVKLKDNLLTEEATKNALILPFISGLGYDVFNPLEVLPEMDCDINKKKGEKIDYAILKDGQPIILIECKHWQEDLDVHNTQLKRYFSASKAKFGVLTNGIIYRFYTDLDDENIMDEKPFLEVNLLDIKDNQIEELKKFHKSYFDVDNILSSANELKYLGELKNALMSEFTSPTADFTKFIGKMVFQGPFTAKVIEQFTALIKRAFSSYVNDLISDRLKAAIKNEDAPKVEDASSEGMPAESEVVNNPPEIVTTEEELEGYYIVKSILRNTIPAERITFRDAKTYFAIFIDDNNRKSVCRLYLNSPTNKVIWWLDGDKNEITHKLASLDDIYLYSDGIIEAASKYK